MRSFAIAAVVAVVCSVGARASAQDTQAQPEELDSRLNAEIWGELGFWTSHPPNVDETVMTFQVGGGYRVTRQFLLRAEYTAFYADGQIGVPGFTAIVAANDRLAVGALGVVMPLV